MSIDWKVREREGRKAVSRSDAFAVELRRGFQRWQNLRRAERRLARARLKAQELSA